MDQASTRSTEGDDTLRVSQLRKRFAGVTAVDGVTFTVAPGTALGIIGPNGAGKSTVLKLLAGDHKPSSGSIHLGERRLDRLAPHAVVRAGVALAHQVPRPFGRLTVRQNIEIAAQARSHEGSRAQWVKHVLNTCELVHRAEAPAGTLRLLDLKRLELARALAANPKVLLLDEVAAGLVGRELAAIVALIGDINAQGRTIIVVEHVDGVVASLVNRVIVLDWGRPVAGGSPAEIAADQNVRAIYLGSGAAERGGVAGATRSSTQASHGEPLLAMNSVCAGYGELTAIRDVDLAIAPGEVLTVLGANGAGKSTLAGAIAGLVRPRSGQVRFRGQDVTAAPSHVRSRAGIALSPEGRRVFASLSVEENLEISAPLRTKRRELAARIQTVHAIFPALSSARAKSAGSLSGGQQQMLAVGRALMSQPALLICDEISLGLAPALIDDLYDGLERIRATGVAIILIEQSVHRGLRFADRAVVLSRGEVTYSGSPAPLLDADLLDRAYFGEPTDASLHNV